MIYQLRTLLMKCSRRLTYQFRQSQSGLRPANEAGPIVPAEQDMPFPALRRTTRFSVPFLGTFQQTVTRCLLGLRAGDGRGLLAGCRTRR